MRINKVKVGYNHEAEKQFKADLQRKQTAFKEFIDYVNQYVIVSPIEAYKNGLETSFINAFTEQKMKDFPSGVIIEKAIELLGIELHRVRAYDKVFKSIDIEFNAKTGKAEEVDFSLYLTEPESIQRYNRTLKICDLLNEFNDDFGGVQYAQIITGLGSRISYDWHTSKATPNLNWCSGQVR